MRKIHSSRVACKTVLRVESLDEIQDFVKRGELFCTTMDSLRLIPEAVSDFCLTTLKERYGDRLINTSFAGSMTFTPLPIRQHIVNLEKYRNVEPGDISESERIALHGVLNLKRLVKENCNLVGFPQYARTLCFVWVGLSRGHMHYDMHNNFLIQLSGNKDIVLVPAKYRQQRGSDKYLSDFSLWAERYRPSKCQTPLRVLQEIPHYLVSLKPGDCVFIPSGAYHAPFATSFDSVSVNAFLIPKAGYKYGKYEMPEKWPLPMVNLIYGLSHLGFTYLGKPLRQGPFELI